MKQRNKKLKSLRVIYEQSTDIPPEEAERRLDRAFDALFEKVLRIRGMPNNKILSNEIKKSIVEI